MKRPLHKLLFFFFIFLSYLPIEAQNRLQLGSSVLMNISFYDGMSYLNSGVQTAYEFDLPGNKSLYISATAHFGEHRNFMAYEIKETDILFGIQPEIRFYTREKYQGPFWGVGVDVKHLRAKNFFMPLPFNFNPDYVSWESNIGLTYGKYLPIDHGRYIVPQIHIGFNPIGWNEYGFSTSFGLNLCL